MDHAVAGGTVISEGVRVFGTVYVIFRLSKLVWFMPSCTVICAEAVLC